MMNIEPMRLNVLLFFGCKGTTNSSNSLRFSRKNEEIGYPPFISPHYYLLQPLDFLRRQAGNLGKASPSRLFFHKHIKELLRLIDFNFGGSEIAAVACDDGIGTLTDRYWSWQPLSSFPSFARLPVAFLLLLPHRGGRRAIAYCSSRVPLSGGSLAPCSLELSNPYSRNFEFMLQRY